MNEKLHDEIRSSRRLLREIADLCEHATLTGSLSSGAKRVVHRYNTVLERMVAAGAVPGDMFTSLPEDATFGEAGVEAKMLAAYLKEDERRQDSGRNDPGVLLRLAPFVDRHDLSELVRQQMQQGTRIDMQMMTSLAPFLAKEDLGRMLREHLRGEPATPPGQSPPEPPEPPEPPTPPRPEGPREPFERPSPPDRPAWPDAPHGFQMGLHDLLTRLKNPMLSEREREELIEQIRARASE